jgi:hypothetical protein
LFPANVDTGTAVVLIPVSTAIKSEHVFDKTFSLPDMPFLFFGSPGRVHFFFRKK